MQCNYNSYIQIINFRGLFRNALRCRETGACRILVPLWYLKPNWLRVIDSKIYTLFLQNIHGVECASKQCKLE